GIRDKLVTGVQTCALPILPSFSAFPAPSLSNFAFFALSLISLPVGGSFRSAKAGCAMIQSNNTTTGDKRAIRHLLFAPTVCAERSEERRVGKEGMCRWAWS